MQTKGGEKRPLSFDDFLPALIPQTRIFSLPVLKTYSDAVGLFFRNLTEKKRTLATCARTRAQRAVCAVTKHFSLKKMAGTSGVGSRTGSRAFHFYRLPPSQKVCENPAQSA